MDSCCGLVLRQAVEPLVLCLPYSCAVPSAVVHVVWTGTLGGGYLCETDISVFIILSFGSTWVVVMNRHGLDLFCSWDWLDSWWTWDIDIMPPRQFMASEVWSFSDWWVGRWDHAGMAGRPSPPPPPPLLCLPSHLPATLPTTTPTLDGTARLSCLPPPCAPRVHTCKGGAILACLVYWWWDQTDERAADAR